MQCWRPCCTPSLLQGPAQAHRLAAFCLFIIIMLLVGTAVQALDAGARDAAGSILVSALQQRGDPASTNTLMVQQHQSTC